MDAETMPRSPAEDKENVTVAIPKKLRKQIRDIAEATGFKEAEVIRTAIAQGVSLMAEQTNKLLINRKLLSKAEIIEALDELPPGKLDEAIALLKSIQ